MFRYFIADDQLFDYYFEPIKPLIQYDTLNPATVPFILNNTIICEHEILYTIYVNYLDNLFVNLFLPKPTNTMFILTFNNHYIQRKLFFYSLYNFYCCSSLRLRLFIGNTNMFYMFNYIYQPLCLTTGLLLYLFIYNVVYFISLFKCLPIPASNTYTFIAVKMGSTPYN